MSKRSIEEEKDANEADEKKPCLELDEDDEEDEEVKDAQDYLVSVWNDPENEGEIRDALIDLLEALEYAGKRGACSRNWAQWYSDDPDLESVDSEIEKFLVPLLGPDCATRVKWECDIDDTIWYPGAIRELLEDGHPWRCDVMSIGLKEDFTAEEAENHMITCVYPHCANKQEEADLKAWFEPLVWF